MRRAMYWLLFVVAVTGVPSRGNVVPSRVIEPRVVILSGDAAPSTNLGDHFVGALWPALNDDGRTSFTGMLAGVRVYSRNDAGTWTYDDNGHGVLVAREGSNLPGLARHQTLLSTSSSHLSKLGTIAFRGAIEDGTVNSLTHSGVWTQNASGQLINLARTGRPAPGMGSGVSYKGLGNPAINDPGHVAYTSLQQGLGINDANDAALWLYTPQSGLRTVLRDGTTISSPLGGYTPIDLGTPVLNNVGTVLLSAISSNPEREALIKESGGLLSIVALEGTLAPGVPGGGFFSSFGGYSLNDANQVAFEGHLTGLGSSSSNNNGIWSEGGGNGIRLVAREGDAAAGVPSGAKFADFATPVINATGHTALYASLNELGPDGNNLEGIWVDVPEKGLQLVALAGEPAPGTEDGVYFSSFEDRVPAINGAGHLAFIAMLDGTRVNAWNDRGLWIQVGRGQPTLLFREGDVFDVDQGPAMDLRTLSTFSVLLGSGSEDGRATGLNDRGQLAFRATFTDDSTGIFVIPVPEPQSMTLATICTLAIVLGFHQRVRSGSRGG